MKIKFIKDYAINRGACPLDIGGFDMLEMEIVKAGAVVDLENDNKDDAFNDELVDWLVQNGFAVWLEMTTGSESFCLSVENCVSTVYNGFVPATNVKFPKEHQEQRNKFTDYLEAVRVVSEDEGFMRKNGGGFGWPVIEYTTNNPGVDDIAGRQHAGEFYFDTREHALDSAMNHTREWQTILNYDWSRE